MRRRWPHATAITVVAPMTTLTIDGEIAVDGSGFIGKTGRGTPEHFGVQSRVDVMTSTLGKALGGAAGGCCARARRSFAIASWRTRVASASGMTKAGFTVKPGEAPIVPVMLGDARLASELIKGLLEERIYVIGFSYPVVPKGEARIRVRLSAQHTEAQVEQAIVALTTVGKRLVVLKS